MPTIQITDNDLMLIRSYILGEASKEDLGEVIDKLEYIKTSIDYRTEFMDKMEKLNNQYVEEHKEEK